MKILALIISAIISCIKKSDIVKALITISFHFSLPYRKKNKLVGWFKMLPLSGFT